ncbi:MAG: hypothetical protein ACRD2E_06195 [Terriglobales bacterium]
MSAWNEDELSPISSGAAQPHYSGRSRWSHPKARRCALGTPGSLRLDFDGRQQTPAGAPGVSKLPRFEASRRGKSNLD